MDFSEYSGTNAEFEALWATIPAPPDLPVEQLKQHVNKTREDASQAEMESLAPAIVMKDHEIPARDGHAIEARSYRPVSVPAEQGLPIYIHFHGGGFVFGSLNSEDASCSRITLDTGVVVLNVNYRHTPEWKYPTAWHDAEDAFEWAYANAKEFGGDASQIVVGGISAGGTLSAALAQTKKRENAPSFRSLKGQVLMIPCTVHQDLYDHVLGQMKSPEISSYTVNEKAPILPLTRLRQFNDLAFPVKPDPADRKANVGLASNEEVQGLPPTTFGIAGMDPLRDEALLYANLLARNGVPTDVHLFKGIPHGSRAFGAKLAASSEDWDRVMHGGIRFALSNPKASGKVEVHVS